jgi:hypothetical protein
MIGRFQCMSYHMIFDYCICLRISLCIIRVFCMFDVSYDSEFVSAVSKKSLVPFPIAFTP